MTDIIADTGRGEQLVLDVRSSAPSSPETHQAWIRDDLTSGEQIGALEFGDGTQVPIYPDSLTVEDSVTKALQVSVGGQMGFIPTAPVDDATYDARRFPYNGVDYGLHSARSPSAIPDGGVSRWEFEQDVTDSWGANDGSPTAISYSTNSAVGSHAASFDGSSSLISVPHGSSIQFSSAFSVSLWTNAASFPSPGGTQMIVKKDPAGNDYQANYKMSYNGLDDVFRWSIGNSAGDGYNAVSYSAPSTNTYYHIVGTWDGSTVEMFVDGQSAGTTAFSGTPYSTTGDLYFGYDPRFGSYYDGLVDDPRIYDKGLSQTEVQNLMNTGSISG